MISAARRPCLPRGVLASAVIASVSIIFVSIIGATASAAAAATSAPPGDADLRAAAVQALIAEREVIVEGGSLPQPTPPDVRARIKSADEAGAVILAQLRAHGITVSAVVVATLGLLPAPTGPTPPHPPSRPQYDEAIRQLGGDPGPAQRAPAPAASPAGPPPPVAAAASDGTAATALAVSLIALMGIVAIVIGMLVRHRKDKRLIEDAMTDSLTGLYNRRRLDNDLLSCASKRTMPVGVLMVDVDNFKSFNDARGHSAGDRVLQQVGAALSQHVRSKDVVYRYGGEEFCVLLPNAAQDEAMSVAERIRAATARLELDDHTSVTVSVGVALGVGAEVMATLDRADAALYDAKRDGRDRVSLAGRAAIVTSTN